MLPKGSIFFPLIVTPLTRGFLDLETYSTVQKFFIDTDTNALRISVHSLLIVQLNLKLYFPAPYFGNFCLNQYQIKVPS